MLVQPDVINCFSQHKLPKHKNHLCQNCFRLLLFPSSKCRQREVQVVGRVSLYTVERGRYNIWRRSDHKYIVLTTWRPLFIWIFKWNSKYLAPAKPLGEYITPNKPHQPQTKEPLYKSEDIFFQVSTLINHTYGVLYNKMISRLHKGTLNCRWTARRELKKQWFDEGKVIIIIKLMFNSIKYRKTHKGLIVQMSW